MLYSIRIKTIIGKLIVLFGCLICFGADRIATVQITPAWNLYRNINLNNRKAESYFGYKSHFQQQLIEVLTAIDICALPALYTSAFGTIYDPRNFDEMNRLLHYEPCEQSKFLTLIPVVKSDLITLDNREYRISLELSVFAQDSTGQLGDELFQTTIQHSSSFTSETFTEADAQAILTHIKLNLASFKNEWQKIRTYINTHADRFQPFPDFKSATVYKEQSIHSFGESNLLYYSDDPKSPQETPFRLNKANQYIIMVNEHTNKVLFDFDLANEVPDVLYAYTITPDLKVLPAQDNDIHVEKSPDALPNDTYTGLRYLVINLPGSTAGSIICYALKYYDRAVYDTAMFYALKSNVYQSPLAHDFNFLFTSDTTPWQLRIWTPATFKSTIQAQSNCAIIRDTVTYSFGETSYASDRLSRPASPKFFGWLNSSIEKRLDKLSKTAPAAVSKKTNLFNMVLYQGRPTPLPTPIWEPYTYFEQPLIRVASVSAWDKLFSKTRDSIIAIVARSQMPGHILSRSLATDADTVKEAIFKLQNFMTDSLQYIHISFGSHTSIPINPDSVFSRRMGDCKDYSTLFIAELRSLGVSAYPALVNATWPTSLTTTLPSYDAFNHMIVYVPKYNWWIDPLYYPVTQPFIPGYLTGLKSLVLYPDSLVLKTIPDNPDSLYRNSYRYEIGINGSAIECTYRETTSIEKSGYIRKYYPQIDSARHFDFLFPTEKFTKRLSTNEKNIVFGNFDNHRLPLIISRHFDVAEAITSAGSIKLLNLPEMPLSHLVSMVSANNRISDLYFPADLICDVTIKIIGSGKVKWPAIFKPGEFGQSVTIAQANKNEITFQFYIKKGVIKIDEYQKLKGAIDRYRTFFSNPVAVQSPLK